MILWIKNKWENLKEFYFRVPIKVKVLLSTILILQLAYLFYIFIGTPALNWKQKYRRMETAYMVGPGEILCYEQITGHFYHKQVLAKSDEGVILASISIPEFLLYFPKNNDIMVLGAPQSHTNLQLVGEKVTVFAVDEYPEAVRAELDLQLYWQQWEETEPVRPVFYAKADRQGTGCFRFDIPIYEWEEYTDEYKALKYFSSCSGRHWGSEMPEGVCNATIRLYNDKNELICRREVDPFPEEG